MTGDPPAVGPRPWHLPGLDSSERRGWHEGETAAGASFRAPAMSREEAARMADSVRAAALEARRSRSVDEVIEAAADAGRALADPNADAGRRARKVLSRELGWPGELAEETLQGMAAAWSPAALRALVREELGEPGVLEGYVDGGTAADLGQGAHGPPLRRKRYAVGPPLLFQVQAGNVPGVGVTGILRALIVRSGVLVKTSRQEPGLAAVYARSLSRRDSLLGRSLAVTWWPGGTEPPAAREWAKRAGKAVVYGGREAVAGVRSVLPADCDLVVYGPKLGAGVVLSDADHPTAARALARDVCAYEQRGCVSPRLVFTLDEGRRERFSELVANFLGDKVKSSGRSPLSAGTASSIRALRAEVDLGAHGRDARVVGDADELGWTVITAPRPRIEPEEALPRVVRVYGCRDLEDWHRVLAPLEGRIQAVGYGGSEGLETLAAQAAALGVCRVAPFGRIAWPPADWRHDGRHQLLPLLRWTELEGPQ